MSLPSQSEINAVAQIVYDVDASRFFTYATFCLLVYDHALTISEEIHLVWQSRSVNLVKVLFVLNRYVVPMILAVDVALISGTLSGLTKETCHIWLLFDMIMEVLSLFSTTYIITLRIRALWTDNREVNLLLQATWGLHVVATTGILINSIVQNLASYTLQPDLDLCFGNIVDSWLIWLPAMVFHAVMFVLLILKAISTPRNEHTKLMSILLVDGFIFFAVVFGAMFTNLLIWAVASPDLAQLPHDSVWAISTLAITRLLLSLQRRYHGEVEDPEIVEPLGPPLVHVLSTHKIPQTVHEDNLVKLRSMNDAARRAPSRGAENPHGRNITPLVLSGVRSNSPDSGFSKVPSSSNIFSKLSKALQMFQRKPSRGNKGRALLTSPEYLSGGFDKKPSYPYTQSSDSNPTPFYARLQLDRQTATEHSLDIRPSTMFEMREMDAERIGSANSIDDAQQSNTSHGVSNSDERGPAPSYHSYSPPLNQRQQQRQVHRRSQSATTYAYAHRDKKPLNSLTGESSPLALPNTTDMRAAAMAMAGVPIPAATARMYDTPFDGSDTFGSGPGPLNPSGETTTRALDDPFYAYYHHLHSRSMASHPFARSAPFPQATSTTSTIQDRANDSQSSSFGGNGGRGNGTDNVQSVRRLKPLPDVPTRGARRLFR